MRPAVIVAALGMAAVLGGLVYLQSARQSSNAAASAAQTSRESSAAAAETPTSSAAAASTNNIAAIEAATAAQNGGDAIAASKASRPDTVEQWIKDTRDSDPKIRAAAITKLANAPKAQALPALKNVLETGEPDVDRHIALNSLHTLALRDGDKNGQVRDVMRSAIYHSDNDGVMQTAQSLLDDVEAALSEPPPK
ncbi:HEAT repeat domain-containing protein [Peristeroidobacter soli]|uniref:HEAT repeat domain-containing protein n=1 Tax=Peristeroidobacter soli TaxID=2497877 RepID=UPI00101CC74C|nr:HEAT repeat domain-containing protein [Peristeroidobacter soli]